MKKGGQIKNRFFSNDDLRTILDMLNQKKEALNSNQMLENHIAKMKFKILLQQNPEILKMILIKSQTKCHLWNHFRKKLKIVIWLCWMIEIKMKKKMKIILIYITSQISHFNLKTLDIIRVFKLGSPKDFNLL